MRILALSNIYPPDVIGGYEIACAQAVDALRARGHEVLVLTAPRRPARTPDHVRRVFRLADVWDLEGVALLDPAARRRLLDEAAFLNRDNVRALTDEVGRFRPEVAYLHNLYGLGGLGLLAALSGCRVPWVWHLGDNVPVLLCGDGSRVVPKMTRAFGRLARGHFLGVSSRVVEEIAGAGVPLHGPVEVLPYWVVGEPPPLDRDYTVGGVLKVVSAGYLKPQKGIDSLIEAVAILRDEGVTNVTLDLFGRAEDEARYPGLVRRLGLEGVVSLRGYLPHRELLARFPAYDVFAFPTWEREPFGLGPLEAAAHGGCVPLISRSCGVAEWLVHGVHCFKTDHKAPALARALRAACDGGVPLAALGARARRLAWRDMHLDSVVPRIERALADAARRGAGPGAPAAAPGGEDPVGVIEELVRGAA